MKYVIGCDIGSQSLKVLLISEHGQTCGEASRSYPIEYPQPAWAEQSAVGWMDALVKATRMLLAKTAISSKDIVALGLDAQVDGVVAVDENGSPLHPAMIWMDRRADDDLGAAHVGGERAERLVDDELHPDGGREMHDDVDVTHEVEDRTVVEDGSPE